MAATKSFELRVLLTSTTGKLLTDIGDLYELLGWMTNNSPMTHQLPRFNDECKPWLLRWFPELADVESDVADFCKQLGSTSKDQASSAVDGFVWGLGERIGRHHFDVPQIPADDHDQKNPLDELIAMRESDEGIVVVAK